MSRQNEVPRPLALTVSLVMTIVASIEWIFVLFIGWLLLSGLSRSFSHQDFVASAMLNRLQSIDYALREGAIIPLTLFPTLAICFAVAIAHRAEFIRTLYSLLGLVTIIWADWYFQSWWVHIPVAAHIGVALVLVWVPSVSHWYRDKQAVPDG